MPKKGRIEKAEKVRSWNQIEGPAHAKAQRHETAWYFRGNASSAVWFFRAEESRVDRDQL